MPKLAGVLAAVALAIGLGACGSGNDSTSTQGDSTGSTAQSGSKTESGKAQAKAIDSTGSSKPSNSSGSASPDSKVKVKVAPLHVSGGGSGQFVTKGAGDNSIQEFGEETSETELTEAAEALHTYLVAMAKDDWTTACSYMSKGVTQNMEHFGSQTDSKGTSCAAGLAAVITPTRSSKERHEFTEVDAASLRREGEQAFLIYHGADYDTGSSYGLSDLYAMSMLQEDGKWKVGALVGTTMGIPKAVLKH